MLILAYKAFVAERNDYHRPAHGSAEDYEGLVPLEPLDLSKIDGKGISQMLHAFEKTPFASREMGMAASALEDMVVDKDTFTVLTLSGAMTPAQMGLVITDMVDDGWVQAVVSTGALMAHGFVQSAGMQHYWSEKHIPDPEANRRRLNRIHRAYEPEDNLDATERIFDGILEETPTDRIYSSRYFTHKLGEYLHNNVKGRGILKSCFEKGVPVFIPAFTDSELGLDVGLFNEQRYGNNQPIIQYNDFIDLDFYSELIRQQDLRGKKLAIVTLGGGVPRNYAQQVGPYLDLKGKRLHERNPEIPEPPEVMFFRGLRICPDDVNWGGLSGCTYEEGMSWGKFKPINENFVEVVQDATITVPWIAKAVQYRTGDTPVAKEVFAGKEALRQVEAVVERKFNPEFLNNGIS